MSTAKLITTTHPKRVIRVSPNPKFNCKVFLLLQPRSSVRPWSQGERFTIQILDNTEIEAEVVDAWPPSLLNEISSGLLAVCSGISDYQEAIDLYTHYWLKKGANLSRLRFSMLICKRL